MKLSLMFNKTALLRDRKKRTQAVYPVPVMVLAGGEWVWG